MNLLSFTILLPLLGAIATGMTSNLQRAKQIALGFAALELLLTLWVLHLFDSNRADFQLITQVDWLPSLHLEFLLGVDGISILFLPLSALVTLMAILAAWNSVKTLSRLHFALLLVLQAATVGVFTALDMVLFFLFWELTLPPIFFLIGLWGIGAKRRGAAMKYTLFMLCGGVPLLFAIILLAINHANVTQELSFSLPILLNTALPNELQSLIFFLLLLGFAVKAPLLPFHTWLPTVAMEGSTQIAALLTGLKLGVYGILRFALPLAPQAAMQHRWLLGILGVVTLIYGALLALQQTNLRRLLAYLSVSHVGLVVTGIAALNIQGLQGAILQLLNFTLIASALMLIAGFIQQRLGSTELVNLGGLAKTMPRLTTFYFLFMLASIGIPATSGFPAELLLFFGILTAHPSLGITALTGSLLGAAVILSFSRKAFWGAVTQQPVARAQDLRSRELALLLIPALLVLSLGFLPAATLAINQHSAQLWLERLSVHELKK